MIRCELTSGHMNGTHGKRGRKPASESRAEEIRERPLVWRQTPEPQRIPLRALAVQLGTSHQLLSFHLKELNDWQKKDYQRRAKAIRDHEAAENRFLTPLEEQSSRAIQRCPMGHMRSSVIFLSCLTIEIVRCFPVQLFAHLDFIRPKSS